MLLEYVMNVHLVNITWKENQTEVINSVVTNQGPWQVSHKYQVVWTTAVIQSNNNQHKRRQGKKIQTKTPLTL